MGKKTALVLSLGILLLGGCKGKTGLSAAAGGNALVGNWQGTEALNMKMPGAPGNAQMPKVDVTFNFKQDGSFTMTTGMGANNIAQLDGTFTYNDSAKQLTLKPGSMTAGGKETKMPDSKGQERPMPITWKSSNEIDLNFGVADMVLKRK